MRSALYPILFRRSLLSRVFEALSHYSTKALYDPSDLTSLYQSRTGGSTGAVDSVVGIMLDKSEMGGKTAANFIAGQSELVTNGGFADATGWTVSGNNGTHVATFSGGTLRFQSDTTSPTLLVNNSFSMTAGAWYQITTVCSAWTSGTVKENNTNVAIASGVGTTVVVAKALYSDFAGLTRSGTNVDLTIDSISIKPLPGYHALAPSDSARGILARVPATGRRNLLTYSEAFDNAAWTKALGGAALAPVVTANQDTAPDGTLTADRVVFDLNGGTASGDISSLEFTPSASGAYTASFYARTTDGTSKVLRVVGPGGAGGNVTITGTWERHTLVDGVSAGANLRIRLRGSASGEGTATSASIYIWGAQLETASSATAYQKVVSARDVTESGVADKYYLNLDGTDDWMQIFPTLNLGEQWWHVGGWTIEATGKYAFCLSNSAASAAYRRNGTAAEWLNSSAAFSSPHSGDPTGTHVLTLEHSGYAGTLAGRYNGANAGSLTPYNYSAETKGLTLFSRDNDAYSLGLDGRFYGGAFGTGTLSSSDRALLERYVAGLTGVTL